MIHAGFLSLPTDETYALPGHNARCGLSLPGPRQSQEHLADFAGSRVTTCAACPLGAELLVSPDIAVEVLLERLVENGGFGMPRTVKQQGLHKPECPDPARCNRSTRPELPPEDKASGCNWALAAAKHPAVRGRNRSNRPELIRAII